MTAKIYTNLHIKRGTAKDAGGVLMVFASFTAHGPVPDNPRFRAANCLETVGRSGKSSPSTSSVFSPRQPGPNALCSPVPSA
jgi:hypothetical protein